ncbi:MAG: hypothetical protein E6767_12860 [Dysgonomonas sp.]|nr:hypothetical protein [Dysgonomonas sp.]
MKIYKNKLLTVLLSVFTLVSFTSCEDDYYWTEGTLDYYSTITASPRGIIQDDLTMDYGWVTINGGSKYASPEDIKFVSGYIEILPYGSSSYIDGFDLTLSNSNAILRVPYNSNGGWELDSPAAQDFMYAIVEVIRKYGRATVYIDGEANNYAKFDLNFIMDIDVYVRD